MVTLLNQNRRKKRRRDNIVCQAQFYRRFCTLTQALDAVCIEAKIRPKSGQTISSCSSRSKSEPMDWMENLGKKVTSYLLDIINFDFALALIRLFHSFISFAAGPSPICHRNIIQLNSCRSIN